MYKLIIRTDDMGYSEVHDMGAWEVYERGYGTFAEVMLDAPYAVETLKRLREMPWVSVGWHNHFWHGPVLDPSDVPSLVIPGTNRFKHNFKMHQDIEYDELVKEMRAQIELCIDALGRAPDVGRTTYGSVWKNLSDDGNLFDRAEAQVAEEYGMATLFSSLFSKNEDGGIDYGPVDEQWKDSNIYLVGPGIRDEPMYDSLKELEENYDPVRWLLEDKLDLHHFPEGSAITHGFHAGYVDRHITFEGDDGEFKRLFTLSRVYDVEALCSKRLHDWIKENQIELCSVTDALYGTKNYQNHLRHIGSDLCVL